MYFYTNREVESELDGLLITFVISGALVQFLFVP